MNRKRIISILAIILVITMILSLVFSVIPTFVYADEAEDDSLSSETVVYAEEYEGAI